MSKTLISLSLVMLSTLCFGALASGSELIDTLVLGLLPLGNAHTWIGLMGFSGAALLLSHRRSCCRLAVAIIFVLAILWLPFSILLAGNLALNFSDDIGEYWIAASVGLAALVVTALLASAASAGYRRIKATRNTLSSA